MERDLAAWFLSLIIATLVMFILGEYFLAFVSVGIFLVSLRIAGVDFNG